MDAFCKGSSIMSLMKSSSNRILFEWTNTWLMRFNAAKCRLSKITRQRKPFPTKYSINNIQLQNINHHPYTLTLVWIYLLIFPGKHTSAIISAKPKKFLIVSGRISMIVNRKSNHKILPLFTSTSRIFIISERMPGSLLETIHTKTVLHQC